MRPVVIENPVINSPFVEPQRHFKFTDEGITDEILPQRRVSQYFIPIAQPKAQAKQKQRTFDEWTQDRIEENKTVNEIRRLVKTWREGRYLSDLTRPTARLLEYWQATDRTRRLFFCQIEALETLIYIAEVAKRYGHAWIENDLRRFNNDANPDLLRIACKMATGSGKTVVMAMLIAWQVLNKLANPQDARFTDTFLVVTPGITIRDRLRVLLPSDPQNFYRALDLVPPDLVDKLGQAKISITNYHTFLRREKLKAAALTKQLLGQGESLAFTESEGEMVRRVCRGLGTKKNIIVINDEAHHCYRRRAGGDEAKEKLSGDERKEVQQREEEARVWISGLEAVQRKVGIKAVYDLSATPFFLRGSGYSEGTLFPWVVSDFSLIDAIECGIVKVPRVPVADDAMTGELPTYRDLWGHIRDDLPKKGRRTDAVTGEPKLPAALEGALQSLYANYAKWHQRWADNADARPSGLTPPVFIVVCNNTNVSKMVYDYVSGWEKPLADGASVAVPGRLPLLSNVADGRFNDRPTTILVDSEQLESGEAMSDDFKKIAAREIDEFKSEYRRRFPGADPERLTDEDLLREVLNTVGKPGKLGENVKCVVSVSMLTEGWDANTVTHILGVRAFGTQLLCEQVVGRGLRRMSYQAQPQTVQLADGSTETIEAFPVEYAEVYGVPFSFIPSAGSTADPKPGPTPRRVRALAERSDREITFPRIDGYRYELPAERLCARFSEKSQLELTPADVPTQVENSPIVGESSIHRLDDLRGRRLQEVAFQLARRTLEKYFRDEQQNVKPWLFPDLLRISREWLAGSLVCKGDAFAQMVLLIENAENAADRIYRAIVAGDGGERRLLPIPKPYDTVGSTRYVDFDTTKSLYQTRADKCHVSHVVCDTNSWEQKLAQTLEDMDEVLAYVKNDHLGFTIPYTIDGDQRNYTPDFIVRLRLPSPASGRRAPGDSSVLPSPHRGRGVGGEGAEGESLPSPGTDAIALVGTGVGGEGAGGDYLNLIVEVTGEKKKDKKAKVATAEALWVPAVNNAGQWGRWTFLEIDDPWDAKKAIRAALGKG